MHSWLSRKPHESASRIDERRANEAHSPWHGGDRLRALPAHRRTAVAAEAARRGRRTATSSCSRPCTSRPSCGSSWRAWRSRRRHRCSPATARPRRVPAAAPRQRLHDARHQPPAHAGTHESRGLRAGADRARPRRRVRFPGFRASTGSRRRSATPSTRCCSGGRHAARCLSKRLRAWRICISSRSS